MILTLAQHIYGFEGTPAVRLFIVGFSLVVLLALVLVRIPAFAWVLVAILCANALGPSVVPNRTEYIPTWLLPLQINRAALHLGFAVLLNLILLATGRMSLTQMPWQGWVLVSIQLLAGLLQTIHEGPEVSIQTLLFAMATIPATCIAARGLAKSTDGALALVRVMLITASLWVGGCSVQFVLEPSYLINVNGRFFGLLSNPQMAGLFIAPTITMATWALLNDPSKRARILWVGLIAIYSLFLMWTGSRTCLLLTLVGVAIVLASRPGKLILFAPFALGLVVLLAALAGELQIGANLERLTSTEDTRSVGLERLIVSIGENPWIGKGWDDLAATENSYLAGFAAYGILMALLLTAYTFAGMFVCIKLWLRRSQMTPERRALAELTVAFHAVYFMGANLEGYLLGRSSTAQTMMMLFAGIAAWLLQDTTEDEAYLAESYSSGRAEDEYEKGSTNASEPSHDPVSHPV